MAAEASRPHDPVVRAVAMSIVLLVACASIAEAQSPTSLRPVISARFPGVQWVSTSDLSRWMASAGRTYLLDAREVAEYRVSHLRNAERIDPDSPDIASLRIPRSGRVVVYCSVGWRSADIAKQLTRAGFTNVFNLEGGIFQWANEGRPVHRGRQRVNAVHPYDETWGRMLDAPLRRYDP